MENEIKNENVVGNENEVVETKEPGFFAKFGKWIGVGVAAVAAVALGAVALAKMGGDDESEEYGDYEDYTDDGSSEDETE